MILVDGTHLPLRVYEQSSKVIEKRQEKLDLVVSPVRLVPQSLGCSTNQEQQFLSDNFMVPSVIPFVEKTVYIVG